MKVCPVDTFENNRPRGLLFNRRELFAYPPFYMNRNTIRDIRWWNTPPFFNRMYRETAGDFRFSVKPKTQ